MTVLILVLRLRAYCVPALVKNSLEALETRRKRAYRPGSGAIFSPHLWHVSPRIPGFSRQYRESGNHDE